MNHIVLMNYWVESAQRDYEAMKKNFEAEQYTWALFIGHLTIEKLLKAIYAKINKDNPYPPKIHNLNILAERCSIKLDERKSKILMICNSFNISARYEDYKNEFYERCTKEYTSEQIQNIEEVILWLKEILM